VLVRIGQEVQEVPRGLEPSSTQTELVRRFYEAFNAEDLDRFVDTLHPHVELQTARGLRIGFAEARAWATRNPSGDLRQRYVVDDLVEEGNHVVALVRKQWRWKETEELAEEQEMAALFTFEGGSIARWQPFTERAEALRAVGIGP
jgi:ketosteroid isomerase-like protein